jgi:hypothetical protein
VSRAAEVDFEVDVDDAVDSVVVVRTALASVVTISNIVCPAYRGVSRTRRAIHISRAALRHFINTSSGPVEEQTRTALRSSLVLTPTSTGVHRRGQTHVVGGGDLLSRSQREDRREYHEACPPHRSETTNHN